MNNSGIHPILNRILVLPLVVEQTTASGIVLATNETSEREQLANTTGTIVAIGEEVPISIEPGLKVVYAKYSGLMYQGKDGVQYRMINYEDLVAKLDNDVHLVDPHLSKGVK